MNIVSTLRKKGTRVLTISLMINQFRMRATNWTITWVLCFMAPSPPLPFDCFDPIRGGVYDD